MRGFESHEAANRFCREHGELRNLLRLRHRRNGSSRPPSVAPASPKGAEIALTIMQSA